MHDFSLLWIFDILEVICHIFPSPQNKLPLLCAGQGGAEGVEVSVLVVTSCHVSVACRCCCCCSPRHSLLSVTPLRQVTGVSIQSAADISTLILRGLAPNAWSKILEKSTPVQEPIP